MYLKYLCCLFVMAKSNFIFCEDKIISKGLNCKSFDTISNDFLVDTSFNTKISYDFMNKQHSLSVLDFNFSIYELDNENTRYLWYGKNLSINEHKENLFYSPRKYKNHIQFKGIGKGKVFGEISILIPKNYKQNNLSKSFTAQIIFSKILDHWGGSISIKCTANEKLEENSTQTN